MVASGATAQAQLEPLDRIAGADQLELECEVLERAGHTDLRP